MMTRARMVPLGEVATFQAGVGFPVELQGRSTGAYPLAKVGDISRRGRSGHAILSTAAHYVDEIDLERLGTRPIPEGSVLFAKIGEAISHNHRAIAGCPMLIDNNAMAAIPGRDLTSRYLYHFLRTVDFYRLASATTVPALRKSELEKIAIPLPPLADQRRIAEVLDRAESLRAKRRAALAQLDTLTQALFLDLFGDHTTILEKWPTKTLGEILDFLTSGSRGWARYYADSGGLFLRIQNVRRDELRLDDIAYVAAPDTAEARRTCVQAGDVLLSITADLGRTAVVPEGIGTAFINQHLSILRTKALAPRFLSAYLASPVGQQQVSGRNRQGVKAGLNFDDIRSLVVALPPLGLQREFARRVVAVEKLKAVHHASLGEMDVLFAALQHRAFRGKL